MGMSMSLSTSKRSLSAYSSEDEQRKGRQWKHEYERAFLG